MTLPNDLVDRFVIRCVSPAVHGVHVIRSYGRTRVKLDAGSGYEEDVTHLHLTRKALRVLKRRIGRAIELRQALKLARALG